MSDFTAPPNLLMALAQALRQAAVDVPGDLRCEHFGFETAKDTTGALVVSLHAKDARGAVVWTGVYDGSGRRR